MDNHEINSLLEAASEGFTSAAGNAIDQERPARTSLRAITGSGRSGDPLLVTGNANMALALKMATHLGISLGQATVDTFPDGESRIKIAEPVVGVVAFVIQPTNSAQAIVELLLLLDALKRAVAERVIPVTPYFGYARQDCRQGQEPLSAALMAQLIESAAANAVICLDLHNPAIEGFFRIPVLHLLPITCFIERWQQELDLAHLVIAAPDAGGIKRASTYCRALGGADLLLLHKERTQMNDCEILGVSGEVRGRTIMIVDDIITTGNSLLKAARTLAERGAAALYASVTHVVSTACFSKLAASPLQRLFVTDSLPIPEDVPPKLSVVSVAPLLSEAIAWLHRCLSEDIPLASLPQSLEMALPSVILSRGDPCLS